MSEIDAAKYAGEVLRRLIKENYSSQDEFAFQNHYELRTVNRYINEGITKVCVLQELAIHFHVSMKVFVPD